jgi:LmbE family N-acetylglucosaminyl deacetylase
MTRRWGYLEYNDIPDTPMHWTYLSPHLDDVALSCGGLLWEQIQAGENVAIWTVCAGDPPSGQFSPFAESLHARWQTAFETVAQRRAEDLASCAHMGVAARHFSIPDCIYRRHPADDSALYASEESIFGELHPSENDLVELLSAELRRSLPVSVSLVCPLTLGGHVDHRLTRAAAEKLQRPLWFYADYPYVLRDWQENDGRVAGMEKVLFPISESSLKVWGDAIGAHTSQVFTFWPDLETMSVAIREYALRMGGVPLWRRG